MAYSSHGQSALAKCTLWTFLPGLLCAVNLWIICLEFSWIISQTWVYVDCPCWILWLICETETFCGPHNNLGSMRFPQCGFSRRGQALLTMPGKNTGAEKKAQLKRKCCDFGKIFVHKWYSQWLKFCQNDKIFHFTDRGGCKYHPITPRVCAGKM